MIDGYDQFIAAKAVTAPTRGFDLVSPISSVLFPFQRDIVRWAVKKGRAGIFAAFGLGKTLMQIEALHQVLAREGGRALIIAPLGVRQEFIADGEKLDVSIRFAQSDADVDDEGIYLTNYESVREGKIDPRNFVAVSLDEADCLRHGGSTKTFREAMATMAGDDRREMGNRIRGPEVKYRFIATATPAPNEFVELLTYAAFLGVMDIGQAKTRFFKRNSEKADQLTIHAHKQREFWTWVSSWAVFVTKPSDVHASYDDSAFVLPELRVHWHELPTDHSNAGSEKDGQLRLVRDSALGVVEASREKRASIERRLSRLTEIVAAVQTAQPNEQLIVWCDLNDEQLAIEAALERVGITFASLKGSMTDLDERLAIIASWRKRERTVFLSKPSMYGAGINLQQSHTMAFVGIGHRFRDFLQAIHRIYRFQQNHDCDVHCIYTDAEREVRRALELKWAQHRELVAQMTSIVREFGLGAIGAQQDLARAVDVERREVSGHGWTLVNNDTVRETRGMESNTVGLIVSSIPFSTQYEYTPSLLDFGHTDSNEHFWQQMDYLTPELFRVLMPGRLCVIHVKDRIVPGGLTGVSFQTVYPFHADTLAHFKRHGFAYLGMRTIVTDVVRENAQTYRLGYSEQCKDGSRMGVGMPEYAMVFRKPPTDCTSGYADIPVVKSKSKYSRGRWQFDAHGFTRSSGNRLLTPEDLVGLTHDQIFKAFRHHSLTEVYDFEREVAIADALDARGILPTGFMLLQPQSWSEEVWSDVTRMQTLNALQAAHGREMHLCPMQFDIADRAITQYSNEGDLVFDPFSGLGTVPMRAVKWKRRGRGHELNPAYFADSVSYLRAEERKLSVPTLFDLDAVAATGSDAE